jgi:hypothetical protein
MELAAMQRQMVLVENLGIVHAGEFLRRIAQQGHDGGADIAETSFLIQLIHEVGHIFDQTAIPVCGLCQRPTEVSLFRDFAGHQRQLLRHIR